MIDFVKVGNKIASLRKLRGLSQEELAEKLYVTRQALSKWENGSVPSIDIVLQLCKVFDVTFEELLCLNEAPSLAVHPEDIFKGQLRNQVLSAILSGKLSVDLVKVFPQFEPNERWVVLKALKEKKIRYDEKELQKQLTPAEIHYLQGGHKP